MSLLVFKSISHSFAAYQIEHSKINFISPRTHYYHRLPSRVYLHIYLKMVILAVEIRRIVQNKVSVHFIVLESIWLHFYATFAWHYDSLVSPYIYGPSEEIILISMHSWHLPLLSPGVSWPVYLRFGRFCTWWSGQYLQVQNRQNQNVA